MKKTKFLEGIASEIQRMRSIQEVMKLREWVDLLNKIFQSRINAAQAGDMQPYHKPRHHVIHLVLLYLISLFILGIICASRRTIFHFIGGAILISVIIIVGVIYFYEDSYEARASNTLPYLTIGGPPPPPQGDPKNYLRGSRRELSNWFKTLERKTHLTESDYIEMEKKIKALKKDEYVKLSDDEAKKLMLAFEMIEEHRKTVGDKFEIYAPIEPAISTVTPIYNIEEVGKYAECPYCGSNIRETFYELGGIVRCDKCGAFHHRECFEYYGNKCGSSSCKLREA